METITLEQIKARRTKIIEPPWFVAGDDAKECGPHKNSGLALVDTGRDNDWSVARLCEWPTAEFIANAPTDIDYLLARCTELEAALRFLVGDCLDYPAWQRPCLAVDKARAVLDHQTDNQGE